MHNISKVGLRCIWSTTKAPWKFTTYCIPNKPTTTACCQPF